MIPKMNDRDQKHNNFRFWMDERLEKQYLHGTKPKFTYFIGTKNICKSNIYIYIPLKKKTRCILNYI